ncbi:MAG: hypothetical protein JWL68_881 [Actinomycetia bacterium]|jgi:hypothetical protein|nr:hypothetical protein [Actinomycetes bacterium]
MSIRVAAQRYPGPAAAGTVTHPVAGRPLGQKALSIPEGAQPAPAQLAQMFWLAVREERLGDGVGVLPWVVPAVWVVVP